MYFVLEIIGTIAFAISGAMVGIQKKMDILGVVVLGMTTATGGGIIRDLIIGKTPPVAFEKPVYALVSILVSLVVFIPSISKKIDTESTVLCFIDAVGLGVFSVVGVSAGAEFNNFFLSIFLGTITGVGGGVLRDIFADQTPSIFVRHLYAIVSIVGSTICVLLIKSINTNNAMIISIVFIVVFRMLAAKYKWSLPKAK